MPPPSSGFTIMEALISLVVVSLMLSLLLPIVGGGLARNQSLGLAGLETMQSRLGEQLFRELAESAARKPVSTLSDASSSNIHGSVTQARLRVAVDRRLPCALEGTVSEVELEIVNAADGGELHCRGAPGGARLLTWKKGRGEFSYSRDGATWLSEWPSAERARTSEPQQEVSGPVIALLRFSVRGEDAPVISWIVSVGTPETPVYRFQKDGSGEGGLPI